MTKEQIERLCEVDPTHFKMQDSVLWWFDTDTQRQERLGYGDWGSLEYGGLWWWMVQEMRKAWESDAKYTSEPGLSLSHAMNVNVLNLDAGHVIRAYTWYKQSSRAKERGLTRTWVANKDEEGNLI